MMELAGKTGIITGGSSGLGFAAANVLAEAGAVVYAVSRSGRPSPFRGGGRSWKGRPAIKM